MEVAWERRISPGLSPLPMEATMMRRRISDSLENLSSFLHMVGILICLPTLAGVVFLDVILRYFFNSPLAWGYEANGILLFLVFLLSIGVCWEERKHIRMELFYERFPPKLKILSDSLSALTGILIFGLLGYQAVKEIPYMIRTNESMRDLPIPIWPFKALLAIICLLFCLNLLMTFVGPKNNKQIVP
jgi:TRAP-type C4-dicarboxylate transport system permease small subunit